MPNTNTPFGARPVATRGGAPYTGSINAYTIAAGDATATFVGDFVKLAGTAETIGGRILPNVVQAATGDKIVGVVVGFKASPTDLTSRHRVASTSREVYVADNPDLVFEMQEASGGTALTANDSGLNVDFVVAAGSAVTAQSGIEINNATEATTNTLDLHIIGPINREDNEIGANCKWMVTINRHQFANQVAGV